MGLRWLLLYSKKLIIKIKGYFSTRSKDLCINIFYIKYPEVFISPYNKVYDILYYKEILRKICMGLFKLWKKII